MNVRTTHRAVRLTARASSLLFSAAQVAPRIGGPGARNPAPQLYRGFLLAHIIHFAVVARFAVLTGGRGLFPGGRGLRDVGGWPTVAAIYAGFGGLAAAGWPGARASSANRRRRSVVARAIIGTMFTGTYLGQTHRSWWYGVPAAVTALATIAGLVAPAPRARR